MRCRDLTCRWPGCDKPAPYGCDLDHTVPYPIGPTHASNIKCLCRCREQSSHSVDTLAGGEPYRLHGWMLPDAHWALVHGVDADWVLGADDVLRAVT